jgi:chromosome segregation ATPase
MSSERFDRIDGELRALRTDVTGLQAGVTGLETLGRDLRSDVTSVDRNLRSELTELRSDLTSVDRNLRSELAELRSDLTRDLRSSVAELGRQMRVLHEDLKSDIAALRPGGPTRAETRAWDDAVREDLGRRIDPLEGAVRHHTAEIERLKKAGG